MLGWWVTLLGESFRPEDAVEAFIRIAENYYDKNFDTMSKTSVDTLLFDIYRKSQLKAFNEETGGSTRSRGFVNSSYDSDYRMSKGLGVTETRVRNLKDKALAVYSLYEGEEDTWWQKPLLANLASAKYDANSKRFKFRITDKGVRNALQNYFDYETETKGNFFEHTLTSSVITMNEGLSRFCLRLFGRRNAARLTRTAQTWPSTSPSCGTARLRVTR